MLTVQVQWVLLISRQGKLRLSKWYGTMSQKTKAKVVKDVTQLVLARRVCCGRVEADLSSRVCATLLSTRVRFKRFTLHRIQGCVPAVCVALFCHGHCER